MYGKVGIYEGGVLVGSNPPTRITHVFHARLKGPMIPLPRYAVPEPDSESMTLMRNDPRCRLCSCCVLLGDERVVEGDSSTSAPDVRGLTNQEPIGLPLSVSPCKCVEIIILHTRRHTHT